MNYKDLNENKKGSTEIDDEIVEVTDEDSELVNIIVTGTCHCSN